jgi:glyoxylase-like metal-dependent hydrolase (beta-lactamase superfamily II)
MWWRAERRILDAWRLGCWHSWKEQTASMRRLLEETFEWVLPGHGGRVCLPHDEMRRKVAELVERMRVKSISPGVLTGPWPTKLRFDSEQRERLGRIVARDAAIGHRH